MADESEQLSSLANIDELIVEWGNQHPNWRTEPEITDERKRRLIALVETVPSDDTDYPPLACEKLTRADVEWLIINSYIQPVKLLERMKQIIEGHELAKRMDLEAIRELRQKTNAIVFRSQFVDLRGVVLTHVDLTSIPLDNVLLND